MSNKSLLTMLGSHESACIGLEIRLAEDKLIKLHCPDAPALGWQLQEAFRSSLHLCCSQGNIGLRTCLKFFMYQLAPGFCGAIL
jgi:hypothetical protein